jgi:tetratricopeptide (TPR) repeat protein
LAAEFYDRLRAQKTNPINQESYNRIWGEILCGSYSSIDDSATKMAIEQKLAELDQSLSAARFKNVLVKARINHVLGNFTVARDQLSQLIALSPHWPFIYLAAGRMETTAGDFKQALVAYHLAALNLPITADGRLNDQHRRIVRNYQYFINYKIADIHAGVGNWPAAGRYYQAAYQSNSNDFTLLKKIADTYYHRGDLPTAMKYNRHGAVRNPTDYNWPLALAALAYESGDLEMAQKYLTQALELAPDNEELRSLQDQYRP